MSWQQELRRLDDQLADGTIDRNEYRRRRDDLLAEVSSVPAPAWRLPAPARPSPPEPVTPRRSPEESSSWSTRNPEAPSEPHQPEPAAVSTGTPPEGTARLDGAAPSRPASRGRRTGVTVLAVITVLVVLLGGGAVWFFGLRAGARPSLAGRATPVTTAVPIDRRTLADVAAALPALPGTEKSGTGIVTPSAGVRLGLYSSALADALTTNGVRDVLLRFTNRSSVAGTVTSIDNDAILVIPSANTDQADHNASVVTGYESSVGMVPVRDTGLGPGVTTMTTTVAGQTIRTAVFRSGNYTVWLAVGRSPASDQSTLSAEFQRIASSVIAAVKVR